MNPDYKLTPKPDLPGELEDIESAEEGFKKVYKKNYKCLLCKDTKIEVVQGRNKHSIVFTCRCQKRNK